MMEVGKAGTRSLHFGSLARLRAFVKRGASVWPRRADNGSKNKYLGGHRVAASRAGTVPTTARRQRNRRGSKRCSQASARPLAAAADQLDVGRGRRGLRLT